MLGRSENVGEMGECWGDRGMLGRFSLKVIFLSWGKSTCCTHVAYYVTSL